MNKLFYFKDIDSHYMLYICGIKICIKHKCPIEFKPAIGFGLNETPRSPLLIVSLTTFPARIKYVHHTINSLLNQSLKADKIILWLAREQFPNGEADLPEELLRLKQYGLTIDWCEDLKSYKKLVPAIRKYPDDIIVTVDDDAYYDEDLLNSLYSAYMKNPENIYVRRGVRLKLENDVLKHIPARKYFFKDSFLPTYFNQLMGGSGCLYPPHSLYKDVLNTEIFTKIIPTHDDVYFWAMAVLNGTKIQIVDGHSKNLFFIDETQKFSLKNINKANSEGLSLQEAYGIMIDKYPKIMDILKNEVSCV